MGQWLPSHVPSCACFAYFLLEPNDTRSLGPYDPSLRYKCLFRPIKITPAATPPDQCAPVLARRLPSAGISCRPYCQVGHSRVPGLYVRQCSGVEIFS
ncbi:hypothetical protein K505DRAFT_326768 [Melanomma pulvis-pyrius CBS 109.77]|uniref:Uncharacterized protein n=1 Tax=Melanomma pulvis-pyrius CBS 109.77 TaxID=1314802 RepID=A0A6A6X5Y4_9PLEO|nr:hypothetical protein K505DRAFT_326768 [Melanomma pulvis-pyrius CBS 109.77]